MFHAIRFALFLGCAQLLAPAASAKGIKVRFLANPAGDSVAEYRVFRLAASDSAPQWAGTVPASASGDTLAFADTGASKGRAYLYRIVAVDRMGTASEPSDSTVIAQPLLDMPDTLILRNGEARWTLPPEADPLAGAAPFELSLDEGGGFSLRYDTASRTAIITAPPAVRSGKVVLRATYFGKFADSASAWIEPPPVALGLGSADGDDGIDVPAVWSLSRGALRLRARIAEDAVFRVLSLRGETVAELRLRAGAGEIAWDGLDRSGRRIQPAGYLWSLHDRRGGLLRAGSLRLTD